MSTDQQRAATHLSDNEPLSSQVERLANFIMARFPGEPSRSEGAIDVAIRLLDELSDNGSSPQGDTP